MDADEQVHQGNADFLSLQLWQCFAVGGGLFSEPQVRISTSASSPSIAARRGGDKARRSCHIEALLR
jgi:hypothetical protein